MMDGKAGVLLLKLIKRGALIHCTPWKWNPKDKQLLMRKSVRVFRVLAALQILNAIYVISAFLWSLNEAAAEAEVVANLYPTMSCFACACLTVDHLLQPEDFVRVFNHLYGFLERRRQGNAAGTKDTSLLIVLRMTYYVVIPLQSLVLVSKVRRKPEQRLFMSAGVLALRPAARSVLPLLAVLEGAVYFFRTSVLGIVVGFNLFFQSELSSASKRLLNNGNQRLLERDAWEKLKTYREMQILSAEFNRSYRRLKTPVVLLLALVMIVALTHTAVRQAHSAVLPGYLTYPVISIFTIICAKVLHSSAGHCSSHSFEFIDRAREFGVRRSAAYKMARSLWPLRSEVGHSYAITSTTFLAFLSTCFENTVNALLAF